MEQLMPLMMLSGAFNGMTPGNLDAREMSRRIGVYAMATAINTPLTTWMERLQSMWKFTRQVIASRVSKRPDDDNQGTQGANAPINKVTLTKVWKFKDGELLSGNDLKEADALMFHVMTSTNLIKHVKIVRGGAMLPVADAKGRVTPNLTCKMRVVTASDTEHKVLFNLTSSSMAIHEIVAFLATCEQKHNNALMGLMDNRLWVFDHMSSIRFRTMPFQSTRTLDHVFLKKEQEDMLMERLDCFQNRTQWYRDHGVPHTLGIMLYGPPGTGKTSTIKAIANKLRRHIVNIRLDSIRSNNDLTTIFTNDSIMSTKPGSILSDSYGASGHVMFDIPVAQRLYVIEDVDCHGKGSKPLKQRSPDAAEKRKKKNSDSDDDDDDDHNDPYTLSHMLNLLDGIVETAGRLLIVTTNRPDYLDNALLRPGRIDVKLDVSHVDEHAIKRMLDTYCAKTPGTPGTTETPGSKHMLAMDKAVGVLTPAEACSTILNAGRCKRKAVAALVAAADAKVAKQRTM